MEVCSKCLTSCDFTVKYTDTEEKWALCLKCNGAFDCTSVWMREFIKEDFGVFPLSQISKDMVNARRLRALGQGPWNNLNGDNKGELMKKLEMWTTKCGCGAILHQMHPPCFECRKSSPDSSKREDSQSIDDWLNSPESKEGTIELGTCSGVRFITSEGIKKMEPGKRYDQNLNEL